MRFSLVGWRRESKHQIQRARSCWKQAEGEISQRGGVSIVANEANPAAFQADAPMLQVRDLRTSILKAASFSLSAGEAIAVRGPSGAGKTLLLRAVADLDP